MDYNDELDECRKKQQSLIDLGNLLWGNDWSWTVQKQEIDFADINNGSFEVGIATFVNIVLYPNRIERQNIGYSHVGHSEKKVAYNLARKLSVLQALQESMCSFGSDIAKKVQVLLDNNKANESTSMIASIPNTSKIDNKEIRNDNRNGQLKPNEVVKPKSPGKSARFPTKNFNENSVVPNSSTAGNKNFSQPKPVLMPTAAPIIVERTNAGQINQNARMSNNANIPFIPPPKTTPSVVTFNPKTGALPITAHPKPLQQLPSNIMAPVAHDVSNIISNNAQGNCFNTKPLMKTIFLNQNTISYNNCHIQQDGHLFNNRILSYQGPNKNSFVNNEWITPTIFHDGFWTENKVKLWANQNDLIHLTPTGDGSKC